MVEAESGRRGAPQDQAHVLAEEAELGEPQGAGALRERMARRLDELRAEHRAGRKVLADLEAEQARLNETLLRISGAVQVLEELLGADGAAADAAADSPPGTADPAGRVLRPAGNGVLDPEA